MEQSTNSVRQSSAVKRTDFHKGKYAYFFVKRALDIIGSFVSLIILSPVFLIIAIAVKADDPKGSAFYFHKRVGKNGESINIYKFRSMVHNADEVFEGFSEEQKREYYKKFKLENDPRITRVGKFLRKTSLDELPQLVNILSGDLSFVGPRPVLERETQLYGENRDLFLSAKPGLTGYWASNGRSNIDYSERMEMELYYVRNCNLRLDIKIIFKTFIAVFKGDGAN